MSQTSMLHVRIDKELKAEAAEKLAGVGLTISDAVRILLTRVTKEGVLPAGLTTDPEAHDTWFKSKVMEALEDVRPDITHQEVMDALLEGQEHNGKVEDIQKSLREGEQSGFSEKSVDQIWNEARGVPPDK